MNIRERLSQMKMAHEAVAAEFGCIIAERRAQLRKGRNDWWQKMWDAKFNNGAQFDADVDAEKECGL